MGWWSNDAPVDNPVYDEELKEKKKQADKLQSDRDKSWADTRSNIAGARLGLARQRDVSQQGVGAVVEAEQSALQGLRAQSGRAFAQDQARGGGGSLARMRQGALARGAAEGAMRGQFAERKQDAEMAAARGATEFFTESEKLNNREVARAGESSKVFDDVKAAYQSATDHLYFVTDEDRAAAIETIKAKYKNDPNPAVQKEVNRSIDAINAGTISTSGALDVGTWF